MDAKSRFAAAAGGGDGCRGAGCVLQLFFLLLVLPFTLRCSRLYDCSRFVVLLLPLGLFLIAPPLRAGDGDGHRDLQQALPGHRGQVL